LPYIICIHLPFQGKVCPPHVIVIFVSDNTIILYDKTKRTMTEQIIKGHQLLNIISVPAFLLLLLLPLKATDGDSYQIRIYRLDHTGQENRMESYLKEAFIPALHRSGIEQVGVFKPLDPDGENGRYIMVLIPFHSLKEFRELPVLLAKDLSYQKAAAAYLEAAHDDPPYSRMESILLSAFSVMPRLEKPGLETPPARRVYELRSYQGPTERLFQRKVEMFNEGEAALFMRLGFNPVFFGEVISGPHMPNLMYMTTFENETSRQEHWKSFREHPDWLSIKDLPRYRNTVSHISIYLIHPTGYSDL